MTVSSGRFVVGEWQVKPTLNLIEKGKNHRRLEPRVMEVLVCLAQNPGRVLSKEDFLASVWQGAFVGDEALAYSISELRKALGDKARDPSYIETIPRRGYRLIAPVSTIEEEDAVILKSRAGKISSASSRLPVALGILALAIVFLFFWKGSTGNLDPHSPKSIRFHIRPPGVSYEFPDTVALSPDDKHLAFTGVKDGKRLLWVRPLDSFSAYFLAGTQGAFAPFWSPEGKTIAFFADRQLKTVNLTDRIIRVLANVDGWGGSWSVNGEILITLPSVFAPGFKVVSAAGGEPRILQLDQGASDEGKRKTAGLHWLFSPHFLPDGNHFLFTDGRDLSLWLADLSSKKAGLLLSNSAKAVPVWPNLLVFFRENHLFAQPFDIASHQLIGSALKIADGVRSADWSLSYFDATGENLSFLVETSARERLVWLHRLGEELSTVGEPSSYFQVSLSPDEKTVAVTLRGSGMWESDIWLIHLESEVMSRLTTQEGFEVDPVWSPDSDRIAYSTMPARSVRLKEIGKSRDEHFFKVRAPDTGTFVDDWSRDGENFLVRDGKGRVFQVSREDGMSKLWLDSGATVDVDQCKFFPEGNWIAYSSNESGSWEVYVASFPEFGRRQQVSKNGGAQPRWSWDGREIFYLSLDGHMMAVPVLSSNDRLRFGPPETLFQTQVRVRPIIDQYAVTRDGSRFLVIQSLIDEEPIALIKNWRADLEF